jgi:hypothetical protein
MITSKWYIKPKNNCFISILLVLLKNINIQHTTQRAQRHRALLQHSAPHTHKNGKRGSPSAAAAAAAQNTKQAARIPTNTSRNVPVCNLFICNVI